MKLLLILDYALAIVFLSISVFGLVNALHMYMLYGFSYTTITIVEGVNTTRTVTFAENLLIASFLLAPALVLLLNVLSLRKQKEEETHVMS